MQLGYTSENVNVEVIHPWPVSWGLSYSGDWCSPLAIALTHSRTDMAESLLELGADPHGCTRTYKMPILLFAQSESSFQLIMARNVNYETALEWFTDNSHYPLKIGIARAVAVLLKNIQKHCGISLRLKTFLMENAEVLKKYSVLNEIIDEIKSVDEQILCSDSVGFINTMMQVILNQAQLEEAHRETLIRAHNYYADKNPQNVLVVPFYHMLIENNFHKALLLLLNVDDSKEQSNYVKLLLAYSYLNRLGCDVDVVKATEYLRQAFHFAHTRKNKTVSSLAVSLLENIPKTHTVSSSYHLILGQIYHTLCRYDEALIQFDVAGLCAVVPQQEVLLEMASKQPGDAASTLPGFLRAVEAGSIKATLEVGDLYRDGKIGGRTDFIQAIDYYYRAGLLQGGFPEAEKRLDVLLKSRASSDETKRIVRKKLFELQFKLTVIDKSLLTSAMVYANESPLLAAVIRERCCQEGIKNPAVAQYYFSKPLKEYCEMQLLGREETDSVYAHFLFASELIADGWLSSKADQKIQGMMHMAAALTIAERVDPGRKQVVLTDLWNHIKKLFAQLQQHKELEIRHCADYLSAKLIAHEHHLEMPDRISSQLSHSTIPKCLFIQLTSRVLIQDNSAWHEPPQPSAPPHVSEHPALGDIMEARNFVQFWQTMRANPATRQLIQRASPGLEFGCTGEGVGDKNKRYSL
ncbi:MAG: hypothetical protein M3R00_02025 [Pseudomonadota bacterium]|nr:hypothetical protein [Pseudomonadota bacterium]